MTIKTLLVPLDGTDVSVQKLPTAYAAARHLGAHIDALFLRRDASRQLPFVFGSLGSKGLRDTVVDAASQALDEQRARTRRRFDAFCNERDVRLLDDPPAPDGAGVTASWREADADALVDECRLSDLVAVIRTPSDAQPWLLEATLLKAARPVLLVPPGAPDALGASVAIGWNDSAEAARAVAAALPFLTRAERVSVLVSAKRVDSAKRLIRYLGWHGVSAGHRVIDGEQRPVARALLDAARGVDADLFVAGAYSRTRASELLFGGVTKQFIDRAELPLLLTH